MESASVLGTLGRTVTPVAGYPRLVPSRHCCFAQYLQTHPLFDPHSNPGRTARVTFTYLPL